MAQGPAFFVYEDKAGEYRWRLMAENSKIVADSAEGYSSRQECVEATRRVTRLVNDSRQHIHHDTELKKAGTSAR